MASMALVEEPKPTPAQGTQSKMGRSFRSLAMSPKTMQSNRRMSLLTLASLAREEAKKEEENRPRAYSEDVDTELIPWDEGMLRDVFSNWDRASENEIRVDDLPLLLADLGIHCAEEYMQSALSGMLYATLDWDDFTQFLREYRKLERKEFRQIFKDADEDGSGFIDTDELVLLLRRLDYPATKQAAEDIIQVIDNGDGEIAFFEFEQLIHHLRCTEGFNKQDLLQLRSFFDSEKIMLTNKSEGPLETIDLEKVWRIINFKGFPCSHDELRDLTKSLTGQAGPVTFRQMLKLIRSFRVKERTQTADLIQKFSVGANQAIQVTHLALALGDLGFYPEEEATVEHLNSIGTREHEDSLTPDELVEFLQVYRRHEGFTAGQIEEITQAFHLEDVNGTGNITALGMNRMLRTAGIRSSLPNTQQEMLKVDLEGSGLLDVQEVLKLIRLFHTQEAELRRQVFFKMTGDGDPRSQRLLMKYLPDSLELIRGCKSEPARLEVILGSLELSQEESVGFHNFERICSEFRKFDRAVTKKQAGYSPEEVLDLREAFSRYDEEGLGVISDSRLSQVILDAFPDCATSARQCQRARQFVKEVQERWGGIMNFEAFLHLVKTAEYEAEEEDFEREAQLARKHDISKAELQGFREIFVSGAKKESTIRWEKIVELFDFAMDDFAETQIEKFMELLTEVDSHHGGAALRFPDFIRLMTRLTDDYYEKDLGFVRASMRKQRNEADAQALAQCQESVQTFQLSVQEATESVQQTFQLSVQEATEPSIRLSVSAKDSEAPSKRLTPRMRVLSAVTECSEEDSSSASLHAPASPRHSARPSVVLTETLALDYKADVETDAKLVRLVTPRKSRLLAPR